MTKNEAVMLLEAARAEVARLTAELADQCLISATVMDERCEAVTRTVTAEAEAARLTKERAEVVLAVGGPYEGQTLAEACAVWRSAFRDAQAEVEHLKDVQRSDYSLLLDAWRDAGLPVPGADKQSVIQRVLVGILAEREAHAKTKAELAAMHTNEYSVHPPRCPVTGRPFFMVIEAENGDMVATYGGPYDSYTIPAWDQGEREFRSERFDHDKGAWEEGGEPYSFELIDSDKVVDLEDAEARADRAEAVLRGLRAWLGTPGEGRWQLSFDQVLAKLDALERE